MTSPEYEPRPEKPSILRRLRRAKPPAAAGGLPPVPPAPRGSGGGGPLRPELDLSTFMDQMLGTRPARDAATLGPVCRELDAGIGRSESLNALLSGAYWTGVLHTTRFEDALHRTGRARPDRTILVAHAGGTRFDLLVMSAGYQGPPVVLPRFRADEVSRAFRGAQASGRSTMARTVEQRYFGRRRVMPDLGAAVAEIADAIPFGAVLMRPPPETPTCVPVPAHGVSVPGGKDYQATVGVVLPRGGEMLVTTVRHVLPPAGDEMLVGKRTGRVVGRDELTDSCLIAVPGLPKGRTEAFAGISPRILPAFTRGHFNRVRFGRLDTVINAADMSILEYQSAFASKFYTTADTIPGDSGTALIDIDDHLVGFAVMRSSEGPRNPAYSIWVCAEQTTRRLEIEL
ncbi:hypothetical protein AB0C07_26205 [Actinoplanes missouriensis]|uniref:hypothetical protein n=1 Tax=Actinoplanes missouriensis TaxID=1866 RepID=UPI00340507C7